MNVAGYRLVYATALAAATLAAAAGSSPARLQAQPQGKNVYDAHCVECHGESGRGDGPSAAYLTPRPRDFTSGRYKIRSTETGSVPTDEDLIQSVRQGLYGTTMPGWGRSLSGHQLPDLRQDIKGLAPPVASPPP